MAAPTEKIKPSVFSSQTSIGDATAWHEEFGDLRERWHILLHRPRGMVTDDLAQAAQLVGHPESRGVQARTHVGRPREVK